MPLPKMPSKPASVLDPTEYGAVAPAKRKADKTAAKPAAKAGKNAAPSVKNTAAPKAQTAQPAPVSSAAPAPQKAATPRKRSSSPAATEKPQAAPAASPIAAPAQLSAPESTPAPTKRSAVSRRHAPGVQKSAPSRAADKSGQSKLFVLDTNVLMHDPTSLFRFEEHDVYLPMITLEELDDHKKGMSEVARNARQVSRTLDALIGGVSEEAIESGLPLSKLGNKDAKGRLFFQTRLKVDQTPLGLPAGKADNQILSVVRALEGDFPGRAIVLVSKDINMRIKARALGLPAEDYFNDHVLEDTDLLYSGIVALPEDFWAKHGKNMESWSKNENGAAATWYRVSGPLIPSLQVNQFAYLEPKNGEAPLQVQIKKLNGKTAELKTLRDFSHTKNNVWGITARNREQNFALNLLMDPECDFVSLLGQAGTGKTLLALAAGLSQVLDVKRYNEIIVTRVTVPVGEDIGFLPGTEEEKMSPWMGAFDDNLEVLNRGDAEGGDFGRHTSNDFLRSKIKIKSLNFMRGRTFVNKFVIIDEAQNLTPKQIKTLITRAGPGTKIVCLGNIAQIDTPYLTEGSSGLTYVVDRFKGWEHGGHVTLARGERSRLADYASDVL
ncbi:PhoH family protein [Massilia sp. W12]|uniref:PhoH family protein n=1 Tax=Massilia sp. W12 TaxID=3126507 RepID=UPI0030D065D5